MRVVIQPVVSAIVKVNDEVIASIGHGLCVYVGFAKNDELDEIEAFARKLPKIRFYHDDDSGKRWMYSIVDKQYDLLCISQFALCGGLNATRPDFHNAMDNDNSKLFYQRFLDVLRSAHKPDLVKDAIFGVKRRMMIESEGPMTMILESTKLKK